MMALWRLLALMIWVGVLVAICAALIVLVVAMLAFAVLFGALHPRRTMAGQLRTATANVAAGGNLVEGLRR